MDNNKNDSKKSEKPDYEKVMSIDEVSETNNHAVTINGEAITQ